MAQLVTNDNGGSLPCKFTCLIDKTQYPNLTNSFRHIQLLGHKYQPRGIKRKSQKVFQSQRLNPSGITKASVQNTTTAHQT